MPPNNHNLSNSSTRINEKIEPSLACTKSKTKNIWIIDYHSNIVFDVEDEMEHTECMTGINVVEIMIYNSGTFFSALLTQIQRSHIRIIA
jgi:hypothetical protein